MLSGDYLTENFQTWQWSGGLEEKRRPHLPADKQMLVIRDVVGPSIVNNATSTLDLLLTRACLLHPYRTTRLAFLLEKCKFVCTLQTSVQQL